MHTISRKLAELTLFVETLFQVASPHHGCICKCVDSNVWRRNSFDMLHEFCFIQQIGRGLGCGSISWFRNLQIDPNASVCSRSSCMSRSCCSAVRHESAKFAMS
jgi:hypothetical protein